MLVRPGALLHKNNTEWSTYSLIADMVHSIAMGRATGSLTPATVSDSDGDRYVRDHEGIYRAVKAEEVRFEGALRVENLVPHSEDLTSAAYTQGDGTANATETATTIELTGTNNSYHYKNVLLNSGNVVGKTFIFSADVQWISGATLVGIRAAANTTQDDDAAIDLSGGEIKRVSFSVTPTGTGNVSFGVDNRSTVVSGVDTGPTKVTFTNIQIEESTGRVDTTTPSEYVSVGVGTGAEIYTVANALEGGTDATTGLGEGGLSVGANVFEWTTIAGN